MRLLQNPKRPKLLLSHFSHSWIKEHKTLVHIILGSFLLLVGIALTVVFFLAQTAATNYNKQAHTYIDKTSTQVAESSDRIQKLDISSNAGIVAMQAELAKLQSELKKSRQTEPRIDFVLLGPALSGDYRVSQTRASDIQTALQQLITAIAEVQAFTDYNKHLSDAWTPIINKPSLGTSELAGQETTWQEAVAAIKKLSPPASLAQAHQHIITALSTGTPLWKSLAEAHSKIDIPGFNKIRDEIATQFNLLKAQSDAFNKVAMQLDNKFITSYNRLKQLKN